MTDEEAKRRRFDLAQRDVFPASSEMEPRWRAVMETVQSEDAKAICLALKLLARAVWTGDPWTNADLNPKEKPGEAP